MRTLIKNGKVVTATETKNADVAVEREKITEVRRGIPAAPGDAVIYKGGIPHRLTKGTSISGDALVILEAGVEHLHTSD